MTRISRSCMTAADLSAIANSLIDRIRYIIKPAFVAEAEPTASTEDLRTRDSISGHPLVNDQQQGSSSPTEIKLYIQRNNHDGIFMHPYRNCQFFLAKLECADWAIFEADKRLKKTEVPLTTKVLLVAPKPPEMIPDCNAVCPNPLAWIASHEEKCMAYESDTVTKLGPESAPDYKVCVIGEDSQRWVGGNKHVVVNGEKIELRTGKLRPGNLQPQGKVVMDDDKDGKEWVADGFVVIFSSRQETILRAAFEKPAVSIQMLEIPPWLDEREGVYQYEAEPFGPLLSRINLRARISRVHILH